MTHLPTTVKSTVRSFAGRVLAMASLPQDLQAGQVLQVGARTIVTPEVRDHLRKWQVQLERVAMVPPTNHDLTIAQATPTVAWQIWWHEDTKSSGQSSVRPLGGNWLEQIDPRIAREVRQVACSQQLADEVATKIGATKQSEFGPTQLVFSNQPWKIQRRLTIKHGVFSWHVPPGGTQVWKEAREAAPLVLLCSSPLTSWTVRRWAALLKS